MPNPRAAQVHLLGMHCARCWCAVGDAARGVAQVQKLHDSFIKTVEQLCAAKEKELQAQH